MAPTADVPVRRDRRSADPRCGAEKESRWRRPLGRSMTGTPSSSAAPSSDAPAIVHVQTKITVADPKAMVSLLGTGDEILRLVEGILTSDVHVRGNEITLTGV